MHAIENSVAIDIRGVPLYSSEDGLPTVYGIQWTRINSTVVLPKEVDYRIQCFLNGR